MCFHGNQCTATTTVVQAACNVRNCQPEGRYTRSNSSAIVSSCLCKTSYLVSQSFGGLHGHEGMDGLDIKGMVGSLNGQISHRANHEVLEKAEISGLILIILLMLVFREL